MLQIEVIGNLGKDAEVKEFSGKKYTCFSVAHTENVRAQKPGDPPRATHHVAVHLLVR